MSLIATARSVPGTLRQDVLIGGEHALVTDQPVEAGGDGGGPSPHELLPAALAACVAFTLTAYARTKRWDIGTVSVTVDYDHHATPRRCLVRIGLDGDVTPLQLQRLRRVAAACPVRRAIEAGFLFEERIEPREGADAIVASA